jgi:PST family polysaccharide transporter
LKLRKPRPDSYFDTEHLKRDLSARTVRGGAISGVAQIARTVLVFAGPVLVLPRLLTPEEFGLVGMVMAVIGFVSMFRDLGLSQATVQRETITHEQVSTLFWVNTGLGFGVMLISAALAPVLAWFYGEPRLVEITLALAGAAVLGGLTIQHQALLRRQMRYGALAVIEVTAISIQIGLSIVLAVLGFSYWSLIIGQIAGAGVVLVGVWIGCRWRPGRPSRASGLRSMIVFGGNVTGFNMVNYFARNLDDILIGRFAGTAALGLYQKAYDILKLPLQQINQPVGRVAMPALSRLVDEPERYRRAYLRIVEKILLLSVPLAVFFITTCDWVVPIVLGERWAGASLLLGAMAPLMFTQPLGATAGWLFMSQDRTKDMLRWGLVGSTISVASFLVGLPWGPFGVAASYSITGLLVRTPILLWWVGREGPVRTMDIYKMAAPFAIAGVISTLAVVDLRYLVEMTPVTGTLVALVVTIVTTLGTLSLLRSGRAALRDVVVMLHEMRSRKVEEADD